MEISKAATVAVSDIVWGGGVDLHNTTLQTHIHTATRVYDVPGETHTRQKDKTRCSARDIWIMEGH